MTSVQNGLRMEAKRTLWKNISHHTFGPGLITCSALVASKKLYKKDRKNIVTSHSCQLSNYLVVSISLQHSWCPSYPKERSPRESMIQKCEPGYWKITSGKAKGIRAEQGVWVPVCVYALYASVWVYIYDYVWMCVCLNVSMNMCLWLCVFLYVCANVCKYVCEQVCVTICVWVYLWICMWVCVHEYMWNMCVCLWMCIWACTYGYVCFWVEVCVCMW